MSFPIIFSMNFTLQAFYRRYRRTPSGRRPFSVIAIICLAFFAAAISRYTETAATGLENSHSESQPSKTWVGTWSTAPQLVEEHNMPPEPGLSHNTLRQVVRVSLGGESLRARFSNEFSTGPVTMKKIQVALSLGGGAIDESTIKELTFNGKHEATIGPGKAVISDPVPFNLEPLSDLAITIHFGLTSPDVTGHPGSRTTSRLLEGNRVSDADFRGAVPADRWYVISGIDVRAEEPAGAVAILGNSITDGRGSGTNRQNRWTDILAGRLLDNPATQQVGVLNQGIGGNCVLRACLGPSALDRFERDVIAQPGVRWLIILHGINDIGQSEGNDDASPIARELIEAYQWMIDRARAEGILVYGATLLPFGESFYDNGYREAARNTVNNWIREGGWFDGVIDFDLAMRDPDNPKVLMPGLHSGDFLHPNETGYKIMGESIDLQFFENRQAGKACSLIP
jgi:lysophospholipase L1-like esterase